MYLRLAVGDKVVASISLDASQAGNLEYVYTKKCQLAAANSFLIAKQQQPPTFYIEVASKMNNGSFFWQ